MKRWRTTSILITILLVVAVITGINYVVKPFSGSSQENIPQNEIATVVTPQVSPVNQGNKALTADMPVTELAWQVIAVPLEVPASISGQLSGMLAASLPATAPGVITIFGSNIASQDAQVISADIKNRYADHSPFIAVDHEGGSVQRLNGRGFSQLPNWRRMCQLSEGEQQSWAATTAAELRVAGIDIIYGPVVDVASASGALGTRVCSGDPEKVASAAGRFISAYSTAGMLPVIKHFPGIGSVSADLHRQVGKTQVSFKDTFPYHTLLQKFPLIGVMTTHVFPDSYAEVVCSRDPACVTELITSYPKTILFSDALDMPSALYNNETKSYDIPLNQAALEALLAGNDVLVFSPTTSHKDLEDVAATLVLAAQQDETVAARLQESAEKILSYKSIIN